ncbi:unnamed protein product [Pieris macdunnoughi]|uniref:Uncharacterized protein n=1 Tax=Pieris macdunnoughi TaxID=345717 RepID=A0A821T9D3_9NEOP|nr:unnamed protein product [Pieris macdunnoughi]
MYIRCIFLCPTIHCKRKLDLYVASNKGVFLSLGAALPPRCPWRREAASVGRPRIDIARDLGLRARLAGHLPTSTPQARVYITRHPPPYTDTPPQITAYKANFIGTCMQYAQGAGQNCASDLHPDCFDTRATSYLAKAIRGYCTMNLSKA